MKTLISTLLCFCISASAQTFPDVPEDHWASGAVRELLDLGVVVGFPDGNFRGTEEVTRYQAALALSRLLALSEMDDLAAVQAQVTVLQERVASLSGADDAQLALGLVDEAFSRLDTLQAQLTALEAAQPNTLALFDSLQENLNQLEVGFNNGLLATQENILTELDLRLDALETALQGDFASYVDQQLAQYDVGVQGRLSAFGAQLNTVRSDVDALSQEVGALREEVREASEPDWTLRAVGGGGVRGDGVVVEGAATLTTGDTIASLRYVRRRDVDERFALLGAYELSDRLVANGHYERTTLGTLSGFGVRALALPPLGIEADFGYGAGLEVALRVFHDGSRTDAVIPGLNLGGTLRLGSSEDDFGDVLIDVQTQLALSVGNVAVQPGFMYRRVDAPGGYGGFMGELGLRYDVSEALGLSASARYGLFDPLGEGEGRRVPEFEAEVRYQAVRFTTFLDAGLPEFSAMPTFIEADPLERSGLQIGASVSVTLDISGVF